MPSYRQLTNKKWEVTIELGKDPITGKRNRKFKGGFKTKKEAIIWSNKFLADIDAGLNILDNKILFKDFILSWYNDYKIKTLSINTQANYHSRINTYIIPLLGHLQLNQINSITIQNFYNNLIDKVKPSSAKKIMEPINGCLNYAYKLKLISYKPTDIVKIPPSPKKITVWDEMQLKYFLSQIKDTPLYIPVVIIALTGLRVGELCGLRWENIDLENGIIKVNEQVIIDKLSHTLIHDNILKTDTSCREVSIPKTLCNILFKHKASQEFNPKGFVITDKNNNMCNPRNISMNFSRQVSKYKYTLDEKNKLEKVFDNYMQLPQFSIHGLRHTHATILLLKNENIKVISQRLGHKSTKVTWDTYSHVLPSMQMKTALLLDDIICKI